MDKYKFGEFIYQKRKELHMTQDELGRKLNVTNKAVSKWETGETLPDIQSLELLASTLNVSIDELITQVKPKKEVVTKTNKLPIILSIILGIIVIVLMILLGLSIYKEKPSDEISIEDFNSYFVIDSYKSEFNDETLVIYIRVKELSELELEFKALVTVRLYYLNTNGSKSEISYVNREIIYDDSTDVFILELKPKNSLINFESYSGVEISYEIVYMGIRGVEQWEN